MPQWMEPKKKYANPRSIEKIHRQLAKGPKPEHELTSCCSECRMTLTWMREHGQVERVSGSRVRLYRP